MSRSTRSASLLGAAAALVLGLTACSDDSGGGEYCDLLSAAEDDSSLADADPTDPEAMEEFSNRIQEIVDAAPDDIKGDWETFSSSLEAAADPESVDEDAMTETMTALENITQNVQDECDIDMS